MDNAILKKRLSTFRTKTGRLNRVNDDLLIDILRAWESWTGSAKDFHGELGITKTQLGGLMGKAKKLNRDGVIALGDFKEIKVIESPSGELTTNGIELSWEQGKVIRFSQVDQLVEFLKKVA